MTQTISTQTITGPKHPLVAALGRARHAEEAHYSTAKKILKHHTTSGTSDTSVYALHGSGGRWKYIGTAEDHGHLLSQTGYYSVSNRQGGYVELAQRLAGSGTRRIEALLDAAYAAAPMIAAILAIGVGRGTTEWDTEESLMAAALRLARDAAYRVIHDPNPPTELVSGKDIYALFAEYDPAEIARMYLSEREQIASAMVAAGIEWGRTLSADEAAELVGIATTTWRSNVSRNSMSADVDGRWSPATVVAWRLIQPRTASPRSW